MADTAGTEERELTHARRSLILPGLNISGDKSVENDSPVLLPLQRYAKKQTDAVNELRNSKIDDKIKWAPEENRGTLNRHITFGHTRKICTFSLCKSAFSCTFFFKTY